MSFKLFKIIVLVGLLGGMTSGWAFAQNEDFKWAVKPSYSLLWYQGELESQWFNFSQRSDGGGLMFSRYLNPSFNVDLGLSLAHLNLSGNINNEAYNSEGNIFSPQFTFQYKFSNGYLLEQSAKWKPYLGVGMGFWAGKMSGIGYDLRGDNFSHVIDEVSLNLNVGCSYAFTPRIEAFLEAYSMMATTEELDGAAIDMKNDRFGGARIGISIVLGREKDADKDGVPDKIDECPDTPLGVKVDEKGCPLDTDLDGIPDYQDDCPDDPGLPEFNGCPDTDGDGIMDKEDDCPELPGVPEYNGCPDTDGDGVIDPKDECPDTPLGWKVDEVGCVVDTDGDGLRDDNDQCPEEYGPVEYMGCPEPLEPEWIERDEESVPEVYFETDKYELSPESEEQLGELVKFLFENPNMNIRLYGMADPRGTKEYNAVLSARRVDNVKKFLMRRGIPESRIQVRAMGEAQEIQFDKSEENLSEEQKLRKYRKVMFTTFFFMR